jgi:hypothetical protein
VLYALKGIHYICMCNRYSFFCWVSHLTTLRTITVIKVINGWFKTIGYPQYIYSDNGPQFDPKEFKNYCDSHFITPLNSSPLHAQSNGLSEAAVKAVKYLLIKSDNFADFEARLYELQAVPSSGKTSSPAKLFYKRSFRTKLPTLSDFYDPLEAATSENKFRIGEKVPLQNDKTKRWDDTGTILVIQDSGRSYLVERDISGDSVVRNNIYLKRLMPPPVNLLTKGSQISPSPLLPRPLPLGVSEADPADPAALPHIRTSNQRKQPPVWFEP